MGLFLGASIVTVFEVLDLIFYSIVLRQAAKQDKRNRRHNPQASDDSSTNAPGSKNGGSPLENPAFQPSVAYTNRGYSEELP